MNKLVSATCTNCSWRSDTPNEIGQWLCHIYTKWYDPEHFCQRHKLLTVEDREKRNYYSKQLMDNIKPSTIAKQFQTVENTHKNLTIRHFEPLPKEELMTMGADLNSEALDTIKKEMEALAERAKATHQTLINEKQRDDYKAEQLYKADVGKPELRLVPPNIMYHIAIVKKYGNDKYKVPDSWKTVNPDRYTDAMLRHALAFAEDPYSVDEESGIPHLFHLACNVAFHSYFYDNGMYPPKEEK